MVRDCKPGVVKIGHLFFQTFGQIWQDRGVLSSRLEESYRLCCVVVCDLETSRIGAPYIYIYDISSLRVNDLTLILLTCRKW